MTLLFMDGFEGQDTLTKWSGVGSGIDPDYTQPTRFGTGVCLNNPTGVGSSMILTRSITASAKAIVGFAYKHANAMGAQAQFVQFYADGGTVEHVRIAYTAAGAITIGRAATVVATSATGIITQGVWNYIEVSATVADSGGAVDVRVNGVSVITFSGDTKNAGTSTSIDAVTITGRNSAGAQIDDVYVCNDSGSVNNAFLGDVRVQTIKPSGAGFKSDLTPVGSSNHWANVDESPANPADYNYSGTAGHQDLYTLEDLLGGTTSVLGVQVNAIARKTDTGARSIKNLVRVGGTTTAGASQALNPTSDTYLTVHETNPTSAAAWTVSDVAALEAGIEVV